MPYVRREGVNGPRYDAQEHFTGLSGVVEEVEPAGECACPELPSLLLREPVFGRPFLVLDIVERSRGHLESGVTSRARGLWLSTYF